MFSFISKLFKKETINYSELVQRGAVIIDVRTPAEFKEGHIKQATNIPLSEISRAVSKIKKQGKPVITCCRSGARSANAASMLKSAGIEAYNGGSWTSLKQLI